MFLWTLLNMYLMALLNLLKKSPKNRKKMLKRTLKRWQLMSLQNWLNRLNIRQMIVLQIQLNLSQMFLLHKMKISLKNGLMMIHYQKRLKMVQEKKLRNMNSQKVTLKNRLKNIQKVVLQTQSLLKITILNTVKMSLNITLKLTQKMVMQVHKRRRYFDRMV